MKIRESRAVLALAVSLALAPQAKSDLIATIAFGDLGAGTIGVFDNMGFSIFGTTGLPGESLHPLFDSMSFQNADSGGTFIIDSNMDDPDFQNLSTFLTDGVDQWVGASSSLPAGGPGGAGIQHESTLFPFGPGMDAAGYAIDRFELTINSLNIQSPGSDPHNDGNWTDSTFNYTFRIYATAIPEPGGLVFCLLGLAGLLTARRGKFAARH